jgi:uncharacterized membrane protein YozB (DUF420 family)
MKAFIALILASLMLSVSFFASPIFAASEPSVGVKEGDWIEYSVSVTGPTLAPTHNITWFRIEILNVEGAAFQANITVRNTNGTVFSSMWKFNIIEGQVQGWIIIPSNLAVGNTFFDAAKLGNVTIAGEDQKIVAGATRTITYASDSKRLVKEWDKTTGVYTYSLEHPKNLTVISNAVATNMWNPQTLESNQTMLYALTAASIAASVFVLSFAMFILGKKGLKPPALPSRLQGKRRLFEVCAVLLLAVGALVAALVVCSELGLSTAGVNLVMQSFWTSLILVSMWVRKKGNYFLHGVIMITVVGATLASFSGVLLMSPPSGGSMDVYFSSPLKLVEFVSHAFLSIPAIILGVWLAVLWRPNSTEFPAKSRKIAQLTAALWVLSYVAGVLGYVVDYTTIFR